MQQPTNYDIQNASLDRTPYTEALHDLTDMLFLTSVCLWPAARSHNQFQSPVSHMHNEAEMCSSVRVTKQLHCNPAQNNQAEMCIAAQHGTASTRQVHPPAVRMPGSFTEVSCWQLPAL